MIKADQIFYNGDIVTMDENARSVEAIAVLKDIILALGTKEEIMQYQGKYTKLIDLKGKAMLPGFIDPHSHFVVAGRVFANFVDLTPWPMGDVKNIDDIKRKLKAARKFPLQPLIGFGYDGTRN